MSNQVPGIEVPKKQRTVVPAGMHIGTCVSMIMYGTQKETFKGQEKNQDKLEITWEFPDLLHTFKEENGPQPMVKSQVYTLASMGNLQKVLLAWDSNLHNNGGKDNPLLYLGKACFVNIGHEVKESVTYDNILSVTPLHHTMQPPRIVNTPKYWVFNFPDWTFFKSLPEWKREKIMKSPQWMACNFPPHLYGEGTAVAGQPGGYGQGYQAQQPQQQPQQQWQQPAQQQYAQPVQGQPVQQQWAQQPQQMQPQQVQPQQYGQPAQQYGQPANQTQPPINYGPPVNQPQGQQYGQPPVGMPPQGQPFTNQPELIQPVPMPQALGPTDDLPF